ncbi:MAG: hypothetical protein GY953_02645, partial [bacterium]|nr:hypothetical protein [bacterium]
MNTIRPSSKPAIPAEEFPRRWHSVQAMLARQGLDLLVAYADDRAVFGPAHARWLANFPVHFEPVCILLAADRDPVLLCGPESDQYALLTGRIPDVRVLREFTHPDEDYLYSKIESFADVAGEIVADVKSARKVGLAGGSLMGAEILSALKAAPPDSDWV